jgi:hypothetical protein
LIRYLEDTKKYFEEYKVLNNMLSSDEYDIGGTLVSMPPDGD